MRNFFITLAAVAIGALLGTLSVHYMTRHFEGFGKRQEGQWTTSPHGSSAAADPYEKAYERHYAMLTLGKAEGISFWTARDTAGQPLKSHCTYKITGKLLPAEFFTLYAADNQLTPLPGRLGFPNFIVSKDLVSDVGGNFEVIVSPELHAQNWLAIGKSKKNYRLVINLYNSMLVAPSGVHTLTMPKVQLKTCK